MSDAQRKPIDPRRSASDFIDDLPTREYEDAVTADTVADPPNTDTSDIKPVAIRPATVVGLAVVMAAFMCGWGTAAFQYVASDRDSPTSSSAPEPAVTVTETKTVIDLPASCERALKSMVMYLDAAEAVSAAGGQQMDIISQAYVAILRKDWKGLNEASIAQRKLESSMLPASSKVIPKLVDVKKEISQCLTDAR